MLWRRASFQMAGAMRNAMAMFNGRNAPDSPGLWGGALGTRWPVIVNATLEIAVLPRTLAAV